MPSLKEIQIDQRRQLIKLYRMKSGEMTLDKVINEMEAEMDQEEVAFIQKKIFKSNGEK